MSKQLLVVLGVLALLALATSAMAQTYPPSGLEAEIVDYLNVDLNWQYPTNPELTELFYDDGSPESWYWVGTATGVEYMATGFTYNQAFSLAQIKFYIRSSTTTTQNVEFYVFGDNGGVPDVSDVLASQTYNFVPASTAGVWIILDTDVAMAANDVFYLACKWNTGNDYAIGGDASDPDGMGFWTNTSGGTWNNWTTHDFMMRAMISVGGRNVELNPGNVSVIPGAASNAGTRALNGFTATPAQPNANLADEIIDHLLTREFQGYNVYRDGAQINAALVTTEAYSDEDLTDGTYEYYVTAVYDEGESEASNTVSVTISDPGEYLPPVNFSAEVQNDVNVYTEWEAPAGASPVLRWDNGSNNDAIGLTNGGTFSVAARFTATELAPFDGMSLASVELFLNDTATYTLKIWTGGSWNGTSGNNGTLALSQAISDYTVEEFNLITLTTPVTIDASQELWIGYTITHEAGAHPAGCDAGPCENYYSNLLQQTSWTTLYDATSGSYTYSWNIAGYASDARGAIIPLGHMAQEMPGTPGELSSVATAGSVSPNMPHRDRFVTGYKVYRDGAMINEITDPTITHYLDENLDPDTYDYYATAIWADNNESVPSNTAQVQVHQIAYNPPQNLHFTLNNDDVILQWDAPGSGGGTAVESIDEGFESGSFPADWQNLDEDGDDYAWEIIDSEYGTHDGDYAIGSASYINDVGALTPDNWLITPLVSIQAGYSLDVWACAQDADWPEEHWEIRLSTSGSDPDDFTELLFEETMSNGDWHEVTVSLSDWAGQNCYIAFVHCDVTDMYWMKLDDIYVNNARGEAVVNLFGNSGVARRGDGVNRAHVLRDRPDVDDYNVYRADNGGEFEYIGTQSDPNIRVYSDQNLDNGTYQYYVTAVYVGGTESGASNIVEVEINVSVNDDSNPTGVNYLADNSPNPFNPSTEIAFSVKQAGPVSIEVYNVRGQMVKTLVNEVVSAGNHSVIWNGDDNEGRNVASGIYFYKMHSDRYTAVKKMILLK